MSETILQLARKATGLRQSVVASAVGTNDATFSRIERGVSLPDRELIRSVYDVYDRIIPLAWVYDPLHPEAPDQLTADQEKKLGALAKQIA